MDRLSVDGRSVGRLVGWQTFSPDAAAVAPRLMTLAPFSEEELEVGPLLLLHHILVKNDSLPALTRP